MQSVVPFNICICDSPAYSLALCFEMGSAIVDVRAVGGRDDGCGRGDDDGFPAFQTTFLPAIRITLLPAILQRRTNEVKS